MWNNRIWDKFRMLIVFVVILTIILTSLLMESEIKRITQNVSKEYARLHTNELVAYVQEKLDREIALAEKAANSDEIIMWMENESNINDKEIAFNELQEFSNVFQDSNSFIVLNKSKQMYYVNNETKYNNFNSIGKLDENNISDKWYFQYISSNRKYSLFTTNNRFLSSKDIWVSVKVQDGDELLGIVGCTINLQEFLNEALIQHQDSESKSVIINEYGLVEMDSGNSNSQIKDKDSNLNSQRYVYDLSSDPKFKKSIDEYLKSSEEPTIIPLDDKEYQYAAVAPVRNSNWRVVTFFNSKNLYSPSKLMGIIGLVFLIMMAMVLIISYVVKRVFMNPFGKLKESIELKEITQDQKIYGLHRKDEFGELANSIQSMTDRFISSTPIGVFLLDKAGDFLYGNPYFYTQFACESKDEFEEFISNGQDVIFSSNDSFEYFKNVIKNKLELPIVDLELVNSKGETFWAELRLTKVPYQTDDWQYEGILLNIQEKKDYEEELFSLATRDKLTGLFNRHYLDKVLSEEIAISDQFNRSISLIIFDIDHFKNVNDTFGHDKGDEVLVSISRIAEQNIRKSDILFRWGGEEFSILMPCTSIEDAGIVAEKIRQKIEMEHIEEVGVITASFGVSERKQYEPFSVWFKRVDEALFEAKEKGRNQIVLDEIENKIPNHFLELRWSDEFNCGERIIDKQHQKIFTLSNKLLKYSSKEEISDEAIQVFEEILEHMKEHFLYEEKVVENSNYSKEELNKHKESHKNIIDKLEIWNRDLKKAKINISEIFVLFIGEVIVEHIFKEDKKFFESLK
ncbi:diguanylate cyclase [Clostridium sp. 'White wine YQ']|uniref:diguanylate cyclase n=1 Tax=Clostridium sp. 'White wine YQ' TaxID=3027474 RepID=UPI002365188C|nr:diguanylate cyclase [Clostridium sp. 'White wine YQ']MDD7794463.1 diguanylate cyclase [Clostridium sp. 'White wine YQ']